MEKLTKRQTRILDYIVAFVRDNGFPPSYREIGERFGISSTATVHEHIKNLERKGALRHDATARRSIDVAPDLLRLERAVSLPLKGLITAGEPIEAIEEAESVAVPGEMVADVGDSYVLKVKGDSMVEDGILSGDYVVVEQRTRPRDGDVVVALLDNTYATLKRFYRESGRVRLQPANRRMKPIYVKEITVQGVVRAVIRDFRTSPSFS
ncbi:hypothetical protein AMJ57_02390 [Parcubacteria bacterium SG8_24]|nr:MAG: hypothetical protein AMJ57_02390 [Parcubacteria bacterium SG8_24]